MTAQEIPTMVVSKLLAIVGSETAKMRLAVPAGKLPRAALVSNNQLVCEFIMIWIANCSTCLTTKTPEAD